MRERARAISVYMMVDDDVGEGKNNQRKLPIKYFPSFFSLLSTIHENCQQLYFIAYRMGRFFHRRRRRRRLMEQRW